MEDLKFCLESIKYPVRSFDDSYLGRMLRIRGFGSGGS